MNIYDLERKTDIELKQILKDILINKKDFEWETFEKLYGVMLDKVLVVEILKKFNFDNNENYITKSFINEYGINKLDDLKDYVYNSSYYIKKIYLDGKVLIFNEMVDSLYIHKSTLEEIETFIDTFIKAVRETFKEIEKLNSLFEEKNNAHEKKIIEDEKNYDPIEINNELL